jgi:hypothetical protein
MNEIDLTLKIKSIFMETCTTAGQQSVRLSIRTGGKRMRALHQCAKRRDAVGLLDSCGVYWHHGTQVNGID